MTTHRELQDVPDSLLVRKQTAGGEATRGRKLLRWLERSHIRVTLLDVEDERRRRRVRYDAQVAQSEPPALQTPAPTTKEKQ